MAKGGRGERKQITNAVGRSILPISKCYHIFMPRMSSLMPCNFCNINWESKTGKLQQSLKFEKSFLIHSYSQSSLTTRLAETTWQHSCPLFPPNITRASLSLNIQLAYAKALTCFILMFYLFALFFWIILNFLKTQIFYTLFLFLFGENTK